jgi:hypothetical protein
MSSSSYRPDSGLHLSQVHAALAFRGCECLIDVSDRLRPQRFELRYRRVDASLGGGVMAVRYEIETVCDLNYEGLRVARVERDGIVNVVQRHTFSPVTATGERQAGHKRNDGASHRLILGRLGYSASVRSKTNEPQQAR